MTLENQLFNDVFLYGPFNQTNVPLTPISKMVSLFINSRCFGCDDFIAVFYLKKTRTMYDTLIIYCLYYSVPKCIFMYVNTSYIDNNLLKSLICF